ncbi:ATP-dependent 6-phosphofructokinase [candidate division KSB3 bacterium]|uniref:ATP-dependent 6-phosphofructokinase n=1 Tax=candidate division KSB3 bacterium TaxID=2044937 RepID=A0A9D5Q597_9BACT|nr:ATP-dependent 6-phosphofructokinase [candidate division KSB3 bacterium]MBD3324375.1 ATP-dependent 6-phosphofructokinase [candidate division KSB3 bacterium]
MRKYIGILTAGGDSPGLNAAIRGIGKAAQGAFDMQVIGFRDGFRGLMENRTMRLDGNQLSGILTVGGTILGTSRDKPHRMPMGGKTMDMTDAIKETYEKHHLDVLVCLGGGGTQKNAYRLMEKGMNIITLPKTIDNDVAMTDITFGFDTALGIATEAIDRLHSTAHSHHRIIIVEIMGHNTGWLALGAGISGGADVILIPEIPYDIDKVADAIKRRSRGGKRFSIVAVAEGAVSTKDAPILQEARQKKKRAKGKGKKQKKEAAAELEAVEKQHQGNTLRLSNQLEELTGLEARVTILGHLQRGGIPSAADRLLATRLGTTCADLIQNGQHGVMVAARGEGTEAVPLEEVVGKRKTVPLDHPWIESARLVGTNLGD